MKNLKDEKVRLERLIETVNKEISLRSDEIQSNQLSIARMSERLSARELELEEVEKQIKERDQKKKVYPDSSYDGEIYLVAGKILSRSSSPVIDSFIDDSSKNGLTFYTLEAAEKKLKQMRDSAAFDEKLNRGESVKIKGSGYLGKALSDCEEKIIDSFNEAIQKAAESQKDAAGKIIAGGFMQEEKEPCDCLMCSIFGMLAETLPKCEEDDFNG